MNRIWWLRRKIKKYPLKIFIIIVIIIVLSIILFRGCTGIFKDICKTMAGMACNGLGKVSVNLAGTDNPGDDSNIITKLVMNDLYLDFHTVEEESKVCSETAETETDFYQEPEEKETVPQQSLLEAAAQVIPLDNLLSYEYVLENFYVVPSVTTLRREVLDLEKISGTDVTIEKNSEKPQILIFHTHSKETFSDSNINNKTIVDVGDYLTQLLTGYGYNVMHLTESFDFVNGVLDRSEAYTYANKRLDEILEENPSIQVVIDLHRDGVAEDKRLVTEINGKATAKIMLFNGISYTNEQGDIDYLYNPYITENLAMTYKMYLLGKIHYPSLFRCIYISGYRYCLHHVPRSMLIEAGAQTNTFEEVYNAMEPLAELIDKELTES